MQPDLSHIIDDLQPLAMPVSSFTVDPDNARDHDDRNIAAIAASLEKFKQRKPIVVQQDDRVVRAGNGTMLAAMQLGWTHIAAVVVDESGVEAAAFAIADNRTAELATWNWPVLADQLKSFDADGFAFEELGWDFENLLSGDWHPAEHDPAGLDSDGKHIVRLTHQQFEPLRQAAKELELDDMAAVVAHLAAAWLEKR